MILDAASLNRRSAQANPNWAESRKPADRPIPTVGHVRDVLVFALRHLAEAARRDRRVRRVFRGINNDQAVELLRRVLAGRDRRERVSLLTWQIARDLGNATPYTAAKAWWNAAWWILPNARVNRRLDALRRGES